MSARHPAITKKRKVRPLYDGGDGVSHGRQSGISAVRIAKPFTHPLDLAASPEAATPGCRTKRTRYNNIRRTQFAAVEEQAMLEAAARKAGECCLTRVST
jgi:hypothetical protein